MAVHFSANNAIENAIAIRFNAHCTSLLFNSCPLICTKAVEILHERNPCTPYWT